MSLITQELALQYIKDELSAGIINLELSDAVILRNLSRALMFSSDYFNYTAFKTLTVNKTTGSGGWISLTEIDTSGAGIPTVVALYPATNILNIDAALLGLGSVFISTTAALNPQLNAYSNMLQKLSTLESIIGRNYKIVGDKLFLDHYFEDVTVEYIPNVVAIENVNEGSWVRFLIDYTVALCKRQLVQTRGRYIVESNPAGANADQLLEQANSVIEKLETEIKDKGVFLASR